jgi:CBS domain containing-hemolysin-like protein
VARIIEPLVSRLPWIPEGSSLAVSVVLALVLATAVQMVVGELLPKNLALAQPYRAAVLFGIPLQMVNRLLRPLILVLNKSADWTVRRLGIQPRAELAGVRSMEELELMIRSSAEKGQLNDDEMRLLARAISFTEKVAADAMIPRVSIIGITRHDSVSHLRHLARQTGHSRFPVYGEDLDEVEAIVHVKDCIAIPAERRPVTPVSLIGRPVLKVPETRPLDKLLADLRDTGHRMAVVVDEYGGTAGIVTVEDLVEEIFGVMADEHDAVAPAEGAGEEGDAEVLSGLLHRHEVEELTGFEWAAGRYETLGGFLVAQLGRFPEVGEVVPVPPWSFEILEMDGHRIARVKVHRPSLPPPGEVGG